VLTKGRIIEERENRTNSLIANGEEITFAYGEEITFAYGEEITFAYGEEITIAYGEEIAFRLRRRNSFSPTARK
jgi:hypothetical protein